MMTGNSLKRSFDWAALAVKRRPTITEYHSMQKVFKKVRHSSLYLQVHLNQLQYCGELCLIYYINFIVEKVQYCRLNIVSHSNQLITSKYLQRFPECFYVSQSGS